MLQRWETGRKQGGRSGETGRQGGSGEAGVGKWGGGSREVGRWDASREAGKGVISPRQLEGGQRHVNLHTELLVSTYLWFVFEL